MAMAVFVLQALTIQRCSAGSAAQQETAAAHIACSPCQIANPLETKHGVENIEGQHGDAVGGIRRCRGNPIAHTTCFVNTLLQNLALLIFAVEHQLILVFWCVELAQLMPNAELTEHALHTKGA